MGWYLGTGFPTSCPTSQGPRGLKNRTAQRCNGQKMGQPWMVDSGTTWPHCDRALGIMVSKGNHPQMALIIVIYPDFFFLDRPG